MRVSGSGMVMNERKEDSLTRTNLIARVRQNEVETGEPKGVRRIGQEVSYHAAAGMDCRTFGS